MTDDERAHIDKPGKTLRTLYVASLAILVAYVGFCVYALLSPMKTRIVHDRLGMTEPSFSIKAMDFLAPVINVISVTASLVALLLLISGWQVLKHGSRRTMKTLLLANWTLVVCIVFAWLVPVVKLQRNLNEAGRQLIAGRESRIENRESPGDSA
jgi:hypothetical protein